MKRQNRTLQSNTTVNPTSHPPSHKPFFCFWIRSIRCYNNWLLHNSIQGHCYCKCMSSLGIELLLRLEDLNLIPEQFQSCSGGSQHIYSQVKSAVVWSCPAPLVCDTVVTLYSAVRISLDCLDALLLSNLLWSGAGFLFRNIQVKSWSSLMSSEWHCTCQNVFNIVCQNCNFYYCHYFYG